MLILTFVSKLNTQCQLRGYKQGFEIALPVFKNWALCIESQSSSTYRIPKKCTSLSYLQRLFSKNQPSSEYVSNCYFPTRIRLHLLVVHLQHFCTELCQFLQNFQVLCLSILFGCRNFELDVSKLLLDGVLQQFRDTGQIINIE